VQRAVNNAGLAMAVLSGATFGTSGSFATSLIRTGWSPGAAVTIRVIIAVLVLTLPAVRLLRSGPGLRTSARMVVVFGVIAVAGAQLCYFNAISHLSVAVALLLEYSGILLVVGWGWARHGHRPRRLTAAGGAVALAGLVLVLDLLGAHHLDVIGVLWGLGAAVGLAAYFVLSAEGAEDVPPLVVAWGGLTVGAVVLGAAGLVGALPMHAGRHDVTLLRHEVSWIVPVLGMGLIAGAVAFVTGIVAVRLLGSKLASFVGLTEVLFAVVFAWLLLGQGLALSQLAGAALVIVGIALVRLDELRGAAPATAPAAPQTAVAADAA
jgi:drug/metabolite transporter (DMT)-like permease